MHGNGQQEKRVRDFNSIKVQLERLALALLNGNGRFQFHKGTIRTTEGCLPSPLFSPFQFHKGTIRTSSSVEASLEPSLFQFHKGTIRT